MAKKQSRKIANVELTPQQRDVIAVGLESEFFKIIRDTILPQRRLQLALTAIEADQTMEEIWYHRGMMRMCKWLPEFMDGEVKNMDLGKYDNEDEALTAEDEIV